jgi:hypothetical protein
MAPTGGDAAPPVALSITGRNRHFRQNVRSVNKKFSNSEPSEVNADGGTRILGCATSTSSSPIPCYGQFVRIEIAERPLARQQQGRSGLTSPGAARRNASRKASIARSGNRMVRCVS